MPAAAVVGATLVGSAISADAQRSAGNKAAGAQKAAADAEIAERRRQFEAVQKLLQPYVAAGTSAVGGQQDLLGLNGPGKQQAAITALERSPAFASLMRSGENAILQNASATGGLRGGNTQAALAQFRPDLLASLINDQYAKLGGLSSLGQNAAAGVGNAGMATANGIGGALQARGAAQAGAALAGGQAAVGMVNGITQGIGSLAGSGAFGGGGLSFNPGASFGAQGATFGGLGNSLSLGAAF